MFWKKKTSDEKQRGNLIPGMVMLPDDNTTDVEPGNTMYDKS